MFKKKVIKTKILFVEQKNDFVSQIAEHFTKQIFPDLYEVYSAGPEHDIGDCDMVSSLYQCNEDLRRQVSKDFKDRDYLRKDEDYDYVIYVDKVSFDEWATRTPWQGKQILSPMRLRSEFTATDDLELHQEYVKTMEEVRAWVEANLDDPQKLASMVSA